MVTIDTAISTEDLLALREERLPVTLPSIKGEPSKGELILRWGPSFLGYDTVSRIAPHRASKPRYYEKAVLTKQQARRLIYELARVASEQGSDTDKLVDRAIDIELGYSAKKQLDVCPFCPQNIEAKTPNPRIMHQGLEVRVGNIVSVPNLSPFMEEHLVTILDHGTGRLEYSDLTNIFLSSYQVALDYRNRGAAGIHDLLNLGRAAASSVDHLHTQRGLVSDMEIYFQENQRARIFRDLGERSHYLMESFMDRIRVSPLFIFENEHILAYAAHAPRYPHHVEVIFKNPKGGKAGNVLDFDRSDLEVAARSMLGIFDALRDLDVTDLNMAWHQSGFNGQPNGFRRQAEIMPRNISLYGAAEASGKFYVVPTLPERTAEAIRNHYNKQILKH